MCSCIPTHTLWGVGLEQVPRSHVREQALHVVFYGLGFTGDGNEFERCLSK